MRGVRIINGTLSMFDKITNKLEKGVSACEVDIQKRDEKIAKATVEKVSLGSSVDRAKKAIENLRNFTV